MAANPDRLRFYVDESALGLGKTLAAAREDMIHAGHPLIPECPLGTLDPEWIQAIAERGLIVIERDKRIRTRPAEVQQLIFFLVARKPVGRGSFCIEHKSPGPLERQPRPHVLP